MHIPPLTLNPILLAAPAPVSLLQVFNATNVVLFMLILFRITGLFVVSPLFNQNGVPAMVKVFFSLTIGLIFFPLFAGNTANIPLPTDLFQMAAVAFQEFIIGAMLGFVVELMFSGIKMTGEQIALQMGISVANMMDPTTGQMTPIVSQLFFFLAILLFLQTNTHHAILLGLNHSFTVIPLGIPIHDWGLLAERFIVMSSHLFVVSLLLGLPVTGILFVTEISLGFVAKVMPQMNIFMVAIPIKLLIGLWALITAMPLAAEFMLGEFDTMSEHLYGLYKGI